MTIDELSAYYASLRRKLNPSIFETEWASHRAMNVEWAISGNFAETVEACMSEIREILNARKFGEDLLLEVVSTSRADDALRSEFFADLEFHGLSL